MVDNNLVIMAVATVLGFLSGLGVGGGSLLLLWLTLIVGTDQDTARCINLLFFLPSAAVSSLFHWKRGTVSLKQIFPAIVFGCLGAVAGNMVTCFLPMPALKKAFGVLLLATGLRELLYKPK